MIKPKYELAMQALTSALMQLYAEQGNAKMEARKQAIQSDINDMRDAIDVLRQAGKK